MFALLLDENTDISKKAVVLAFVRFIWDFQLYEGLLFSYELIHTKVDDILNAFDQFFSQYGISCKKCVGITSAGAMSGYKTGLLGKLKAIAQNVKWTHCCVHREALAAKKCLECLNLLLMKLLKLLTS